MSEKFEGLVNLPHPVSLLQDPSRLEQALAIFRDNEEIILKEIEGFGFKRAIEAVINELVNKSSDTILSSHNDTLVILRSVFSDVGIRTPFTFPILKNLDDHTFLDYLNSEKQITKPDIRKYLLNVFDDAPNIPRNQKLKTSTRAKATIGLLYSYGKEIKGSSPSEAFPKYLEYKVFQIASKIFELKPIKSILDFDNHYASDELIKTISSNNNGIELSRMLERERHLNRGVFCFIYSLFKQIDKLIAARNGDKFDHRVLSDLEYNIALVCLYTVQQFARDRADFKVLLSFLNSNTASYLYREELSISSDNNDKLIYQDNYKLTEFAGELMCLVDAFEGSLIKISNGDFSINYPDKCLLIESGIRDYADKILKLIPYKSTLEQIATLEIREQVENLIEIKALHNFLLESEVIDKSFDIPIQRIVQIDDVVSSYSTLDDEIFAENISIITKNVEMIRLVFNEEKIESFRDLENKIISGTKSIVELAYKHEFDTINELTQQLTESKSNLFKLIDKLILSVHKNLTPIKQAKVEVENDENSQSLEDLTKENAKLNGQISTIQESMQLLELEIERTKENLEKSTEINTKLGNELSKLQAVHNGLIKKTADSKPGYSEAMCNILFGKASVKDVVTAISDAYPYVVFSDNIEKQLDKCLYSQPEKLHVCLKLLVDDYYKSITSGEPDSVARKIIEPHYSANESDTTMNDVNLRNKRNFKIMGNTYLMEQHLTIGKEFDPAKTVQVYFQILDGALQIGYIGSHLDVSSNK